MPGNIVEGVAPGTTVPITIQAFEDEQGIARLAVNTDSGGVQQDVFLQMLDELRAIRFGIQYLLNEGNYDVQVDLLEMAQEYRDQTDQES